MVAKAWCLNIFNIFPTKHPFPLTNGNHDKASVCAKRVQRIGSYLGWALRWSSPLECYYSLPTSVLSLLTATSRATRLKIWFLPEGCDHDHPRHSHDVGMQLCGLITWTVASMHHNLVSGQTKLFQLKQGISYIECCANACWFASHGITNIGKSAFEATCCVLIDLYLIMCWHIDLTYFLVCQISLCQQLKRGKFWWLAARSLQLSSPRLTLCYVKTNHVSATLSPVLAHCTSQCFSHLSNVTWPLDTLQLAAGHLRPDAVITVSSTISISWEEICWDTAAYSSVC